MPPQPPPHPTTTLVRHIGQLVSLAQTPLPGATGPLQVLNNAAILATTEGKICWIGPDQLVEAHLARSPQAPLTVINAHHRVVTPGFVDSHTHLLFAGDRSTAFHQRRQGISYSALLRQGRGMVTTMNATRQASTALLSNLARERLTSWRAHGTTTVEIKTGYGLNLEAEQRCLHIINTLNQHPAPPMNRSASSPPSSALIPSPQTIAHIALPMSIW